MEGDRISVVAGKLTMEVGSRVVDERQLEELVTARVVSLQNGLFQGEEPFYVLSFPTVAWVVPDDTRGLVQLWKAIKPLMQNRIERVEDAHLPWRLRRRVLGLIPLFPLPTLGSFPLSSMPSWPSTSVVSPDRYDELIQGGL